MIGNRVVVLLLALFGLMAVALDVRAATYTPPPIAGAVMDEAHALSASEKQEIEKRLLEQRNRTTDEVVVFLLPSLQGRSIEDVAYGAFNGWGVGKKGKDNGVLLVVAMAEHLLRI